MNLTKFIFVTRLIALSFILSGCARYDHEDKMIRTAVAAAQLGKKTEEPTFTLKEISIEEAKKTFNITNEVDWKLPIYIYETNGFKQGDVYTLYGMDALLRKHFLDEYIATEDGKLVNKNSNAPLDRHIISGGGFMNAEPSYHVLVAKDGILCRVAMNTPNPVKSTFSDGAHMSLVMMHPEPPAFILVGHGFKPNEHLSFESTSCHEKLVSELTANPDGTIYSVLLPGVIGEIGGKASITIGRPDNTSKTLEYWWGIDAMIHKQKSVKPGEIEEQLFKPFSG